MKIDSFTGEYHFLSNFYPQRVEYEGEIYPTSEHAFQAAKTLDPRERDQFTDPHLTPGQAKRLGRKVSLRPDWDDVKFRVMAEILDVKFAPGTELAVRLKNTGDTELIEGNHWGDRIWGQVNGEGENWLGCILMGIRDELQEAQA